MALLIATFIPGLGVKVGGAQRWLNLGFITAQPVEVVKFFVIVFLAASLSNKGKKRKMRDFQNGFVPVVGLLAAPVLLALQPDLGNIILIAIVSFFLLLLSQTKLLYLLVTSITAGLF